MTATAASRPRRAANVVRGELPDGEVVVSVAGGVQALILNSVADAVLGLCDGTRTIGDIAALVHDTVTVPSGADVAGDIVSVIDQLTRAGVIETA